MLRWGKFDMMWYIAGVGSSLKDDERRRNVWVRRGKKYSGSGQIMEVM